MDVLEFFSRTYPSNALVDTLRYIAGFLGLTAFLFATVRFLSHKLFWAALAFMSLGLLTAFTALEAIGMPFVPWRTPLLLLGNAAACAYLYQDRERRG